MILTARSGRVRDAGKLARRAFRDEQRRFLAEGPQAVLEALRFGAALELFCVPEVAPHWHGVMAYLGDAVPLRLVDEGALKVLTETTAPQGVVAICAYVDRPLEVLAEAAVVAVCAEIRDPGNLGTVIRCADAAGAGGVIVAGESVDPYNGKAVRASAGSLFHLPIVRDSDTTQVLRGLQASGFTVLATTAQGELDTDDAEAQGLLEGRVAWLFGNEARGLAPEVAAAANYRVRIPLYGQAESLNLATAAAVCLYNSARVRRRLDVRPENADPHR